MKVMISLVGDQPIPNLLILRYEQPEEAVLVFTDKTKEVTKRLHNLLKEIKIHPLHTDPYDVQKVHEDLESFIKSQNWRSEGLIFNLTGGTKPMVLAAYQIARELRAPFLYLQSERKRSLLYCYEFEAGEYCKKCEKILPELINIDDYLQAYLGKPPQKRTKPRDEFGHIFEENIADALKEIGLEVKVGVNLAGALEVDLVVRRENQVGVIQAKTGEKARKKAGLDQLNAACEQRYLGTYTAKMLVINEKWDETLSNLRELAEAWRITVIELPSFTKASRCLSAQDKQHLQEKVLGVLGG